jgi:hypothetical protein
MSRCGGATLVTGIDVWPFGSLLAPGGASGSETTAVGADVAELEPWLLRAVTATRSRDPRSRAGTAYVWPVEPDRATQFWPALLHRSHWNVNTIG